MRDILGWVKRLKLNLNHKYEKGKKDERLEILKLLRSQEQAWAEYAIGLISRERSKDV